MKEAIEKIYNTLTNPKIVKNFSMIGVISMLSALILGVIIAQFDPDGYNIGVNVGDAAGQKIFHVHIHLIPRFKKETSDEKTDIKHHIQKKRVH